MRAKIIALAGLASILTAGVIAGTLNPRGKQEGEVTERQKAKLEEKEKDGTIKLHERARLAKARHQKQIVVPGVVSLYPTFSRDEELNEALSAYSLIIAEPVLIKPYIDAEERIRSWYKFRIIERLSEAPPRLSHITRTVPEQFLPLLEDELVIHREGGTVIIDGVEVNKKEDGVSSFRKKQRYLLFVSFDPSTKVAELAFGGQSVLSLNPDNTLDVNRQDHILQRLIQTRYGGSLSRLKSHLKK